MLSTINMLGFISAKPKKSSCKCQGGKGDRKMYKNKEDKKGWVGKLTFVT